MDQEITSQVAGHSKIMNRYERRKTQLATKREKLLSAWYADAIPVELLKKEQLAIDQEAETLEAGIGVDVNRLQDARRLADGAIGLLSRCRESYVESAPDHRRRWNRILFKKVLIGERQVKGFEYQEPYATLFAWAGSN